MLNVKLDSKWLLANDFFMLIMPTLCSGKERVGNTERDGWEGWQRVSRLDEISR